MIFLYFYWVDKVARPWKMEALVCSFGLPESRLRGICWRRDLIKTSFWYFQLKNETEKSEQKRIENCRKNWGCLGLSLGVSGCLGLSLPVWAVPAALGFLGCFGCLGLP